MTTVDETEMLLQEIERLQQALDATARGVVEMTVILANKGQELEQVKEQERQLREALTGLKHYVILPTRPLREDLMEMIEAALTVPPAKEKP